MNDHIKPLPGGHQVLSFTVVNRWGQVEYSAEGQIRGWDGTFNGELQELGTYF